MEARITPIPTSTMPSMSMSIEFASTKPIIGMVHLLPLPGCARGGRDMDEVIQRAEADAAALAEGGLDGIMIENFFDAPFHKDHVPAVTVSAMTRAVHAIRQATRLPIGVNVLRNDVAAAM